MRIHRSLGYGMPELDRFERSFAAGWRAAYKWAREGTASDAEISDKLIGSLARTLRERGGIPGLRELSEVVANGVTVLLGESYAALDCIVRDHDGHRHTKVAADAAKFILVSQRGATDPSDSGGLTELFAIRTCEDIVAHKFFGNARQHLVAEGRLSNHAAAYGWQRRIERLNRPAIRRIASQLMEDPSAARLRAPRRSVPREPTSSLLGENLRPSRSLTRASSGPSR